MNGFSVGLAIVLATELGVASHIFYFIRGEHHMQSPQLLLCLVAAPLLLFLAVLKVNSSPLHAAVITAISTSSFLSALTASILTYRAFFHPLRNFPGPLTAKLSKLSHVLRLSKQLNNYAQADQLHKKYGEFVRVGPNELTIVNPEAISAIDGIGSRCTKAPWYDAMGFPNVSVNATRDPILHAKRRKIWDRGFNAKALRDYEGRITNATNELEAQLKSFSSQPVNVSLWFNFFSFDVMGDLAFGKTFEMMKTGEQHYALRLLQEGMGSHGLISPIPWIFPIVGNLPGAGNSSRKFAGFCSAQISARKKYTPEKPDIMSWLIDAEKIDNDPIHKDPRWLAGDTRLVIVAGSDTVASTLTFIFYHLANSPQIASRLQKEIGTVGQEFRDLQNATYLNGVINEALRLHPPTPSGLPRQTPPEGLNIGSTFVPGNVTVSVPTWSLGRLESCFTRADDFLPERWGDKPALVKNKAAFTPFSSGVSGCVGKQLALMELRAVTARLITHFDVGFAPGEDGKDLMEKTKDVFTLHMAPLKLTFTPRKD